VPEPGLVIWGTLVNQNNPTQAIPITSASWSVTDGSKTAVYSTATKASIQIANLDGKSYYILQVPFDTRQIGTVTLADPATTGLNSFELKSTSPPTYTLVPTMNGALASVRAIDGAPASGGNLPVAGFAAVARGRVIRVDLGIVPVANDYESWAARIFGNSNLPEAARTADPDGDGLTNEAEFAAGTDPKDPTSVLRILAISMDSQDGRVAIGWRTVSGHDYIIESASSPQGPWTALDPQVSGLGDTTQATIERAAGELMNFYRVRLAPSASN
jgi:hypothetical protein